MEFPIVKRVQYFPFCLVLSDQNLLIHAYHLENFVIIILTWLNIWKSQYWVIGHLGVSSQTTPFLKNANSKLLWKIWIVEKRIFQHIHHVHLYNLLCGVFLFSWQLLASLGLVNPINLLTFLPAYVHADQSLNIRKLQCTFGWYFMKICIWEVLYATHLVGGFPYKKIATHVVT